MIGSLASRVKLAKDNNRLFFAALLDEATIRRAFGEAAAAFADAKIFTLALTLQTFLSQVLSEDGGCRAALGKLVAHLAAAGKKTPSSKPGAYSIARGKLDEGGMTRLLEGIGREIDSQADWRWRWRGRRVLVVDGTTATAADTPENQKEYPQPASQEPGCGWPMLRVVVFFSLASGVVLKMACGKSKGKGTSELGLFREMFELVEEDDLLLADRFYNGWFDVARTLARGASFAMRIHQRRKVDFRRGARLGKGDHIVLWHKPARPDWLSQEEYDSLPAAISIREIRVRIERAGFRAEELIAATDLIDDVEFAAGEIAELYRRRWQAELNLRDLKTTLRMDHLRCLAPHRVRNELRAHLIGYNLIRQAMLEAAAAEGLSPYSLSFKSTLRKAEEYLKLIGTFASAESLLASFYGSCVEHIVGDRPGRSEPRVKKRRAKNYPLMNRPRRDYAEKKVAPRQEVRAI